MKNHQSTTSLKASRSRAKSTGLIRPIKTKRDANALIAKANQITHKAADAAVDHVVRPAVQATRSAALAIEAHADQTNQFMTNALQKVEKRFHDKPARTLGCAIGLGVMIGLWLRGK